MLDLRAFFTQAILFAHILGHVGDERTPEQRKQSRQLQQTLTLFTLIANCHNNRTNCHLVYLFNSACLTYLRLTGQTLTE